MASSNFIKQHINNNIDGKMGEADDECNMSFMFLNGFNSHSRISKKIF